MYRLAIFDFDGTLVDSAPGIVRIMKEVVEERGYPEQMWRKWSTLIGVPLQRQMEIVFPDKDQDFHSEFADYYRSHYDSNVIELCPLFPGLVSMLDSLRANNVLVTIATSKRSHLVTEVVDFHNLSHYFEMIVGAQEVTMHKPHPESVHITVDKLKVDLKDVVVIGDSTYDLDMASGAGVDSIAVTTGIHTADLLWQSGPIHVATGLHEVTPIILNGRGSKPAK